MRSIRIGSLFDIPIRLDFTFLIVLPLFAYLIGAQVELTADAINRMGADLNVEALAAGTTPWLLGIAAAVGLFAGVVLHELGHSLVARRYGFPIDSITLWLFGGIAQMEEMPEDWRQELAIAVAGPIVSVLLGVLSYLVFLALPSGFHTGRFVFGYLAILNVVLAGFNMLPGFPMDGGRVLRALLARDRPFAQATQIAAEVGKGFAILLGIFGLFQLNIILIGIAFFIYIGAASEAQQTVMKAAFEDVAVADIMTPASNVDTVPPDASVARLLELMFSQRHTGYPVLRNGELVGMVTLEDAQGVDQVERDAYTVADVMSNDLKIVRPDADAMSALEGMQEHGIGRLLVTDETGELVGLISRTDLMTAFDIIQSGGSLDAAEAAAGDATTRP